jgi:hypothetical protein
MANIKENKRFHFTYKTTNLINGRYYLGMHSTNRIDDGYLGSGKRLYYELNKYGRDNFKFEILEQFNSREELVQAEINLITEQDLKNLNCLNLKQGGSGGFTEEDKVKGRELANKAKAKLINEDPEFREKYYKAIQKGIKNAKERGVKFSNISENFSWEGKRHRPETLEKMRNTRKERDLGKGPSNSQYGTCWITNEVENRKIQKGDLIPEGWRLGRKIKNNTGL